MQLQLFQLCVCAHQFFRADGVEYDFIQHIGRNRRCSQYTPVTEIRMLHLVSRLKALTLCLLGTLSFFQLARKLDGLALVALAERLTVAVMYQHLTVDDILGYLLRKA